MPFSALVRSAARRTPWCLRGPPRSPIFERTDVSSARESKKQIMCFCAHSSLKSKRLAPSDETSYLLRSEGGGVAGLGVTSKAAPISPHRARVFGSPVHAPRGQCKHAGERPHASSDNESRCASSPALSWPPPWLPPSPPPRAAQPAAERGHCPSRAPSNANDSSAAAGA